MVKSKVFLLRKAQPYKGAARIYMVNLSIPIFLDVSFVHDLSSHNEKMIAKSKKCIFIFQIKMLKAKMWSKGLFRNNKQEQG